MTTISLLLFGALLFVLLSSGFKRQKLEQYAKSGPRFDVSEVFDGAVLCEGVIYGPMGSVTSRFVATMDGKWSKDAGNIHEVFTYANGEEQSRNWRITVKENGHFEATADDIVGVAKGRQLGSAARLTYRLRLPESAGGHVLSVTDWMYQLDNGTIINRSEMRKFGFKVAELVATMRPLGASDV
ncbi:MULTISPECIES: DUF3833 domain-containing protein [Halocynthiibacter]|uniref:DUF3833 domain-containing protein n=1 Tax=Halocynthiibacter halioticoli TaxID=2986804 RepID=A0AAE3IY75_9RHOB|nr:MULTISPECIES: DUF3833 domain-containing protein [Halocynthiibacter]MCV6823101.1 DUF3833 domain-containing protein [Halocynthiibacter halioticoli]MCW4056102.1 DUF3833 domain-containing protein [Halocynthiibacter sp. SDUM655004]